MLVSIICLIAIIIATVLPSIVNSLFMTKEFPTGTDLGNVEWLGFWGGYLGGFLGSVAALIALVITIWQQDKYNAESKEAARLSHLPALSFTFIPYAIHKDTVFNCMLIHPTGNVETHSMGDQETLRNYLKQYKNSHTIACYEIRNIGIWPAFEVQILANKKAWENDACANIGTIGINQAQFYIVALPSKQTTTICFFFKDVFNNSYMESCDISYDKSHCTYKYSSITPPKLQSKSPQTNLFKR